MIYSSPLSSGQESSGLFKVIEELDNSKEMTLLVRNTPVSTGSYACLAIPERLKHLSNEATISKKDLLKEGIHYVTSEVAYKSREFFGFITVMIMMEMGRL